MPKRVALPDTFSLWRSIVATYQAIAAISSAIVTALKDASPGSPFEGMSFGIYGTKQFEKPMDEGVSLFLFRLGAGSRRNLPLRTGRNGETYRPLIAVDLHYLITAWGKTPAQQQLLLGWALSQLASLPTIPSFILNNFAPDVFQPQDSVDLIFDPLSLQDIANLWEPLKSNYQASATYVARMVVIESQLVTLQTAPVQTRQFDFNKETGE